MATKPRHLKTPIQLWVYDNAKRLNLKDADLARATGVEPGTARSWFSRGNPNADAIPILERLFGKPAPREETGPSTTGEAGILAMALERAIDRQTQMFAELLLELRTFREQQVAFLRGVAGEPPERSMPEPDPAPELPAAVPPVGRR